MPSDDGGDQIGGSPEDLLVPPKDDRTAGLDLKTQPPAYHDLDVTHYLKFDAQEWGGRTKKYKQEVVRHAERIRVLREEVGKLQEAFENDTRKHANTLEHIDEANQKLEEQRILIKEEMARREELISETTFTRRHRDNLTKTKAMLMNEISTMRTKVASIKGEVERNQQKWQEATHEKGKLNSERDWFHRERVLLEYTTQHEMEDFGKMKEKIDAMRTSLQQSWVDAKQRDVAGHLRATKSRPGDDNWFAARTRTLPRDKYSVGSAEI